MYSNRWAAVSNCIPHKVHLHVLELDIPSVPKVTKTSHIALFVSVLISFHYAALL